MCENLSRLKSKDLYQYVWYAYNVGTSILIKGFIVLSMFDGINNQT